MFAERFSSGMAASSGSSGTSSAGAAGRGTSGRGAGGAGSGGTGTAGVGGRPAGGMRHSLAGAALAAKRAPATAARAADTGSCTAPPDPRARSIGFAASVSGNNVTTTTGGGTATPVTVTTLADFTSAVKGTNAGVIYVKGTLAPGKVSVGSNKTIAGLCGAEIHGHLELGGSTNVIVRNLTIVGYGVGDCSLDPDYDSGTGCSSGNDAVSVQKNAHHIWFDHCDISDGTDGNLDITNGANYVTVSWTKFHYTARKDPDRADDSTGDAGHRFSNLVGGTDTPSTYDDANSLNITWHLRLVGGARRRGASRAVRFWQKPPLQQLFPGMPRTTTTASVPASRRAFLIEDGVFDGVKDPHVFNNSDDENTANIIAGSDNLYPSATGTKATGGGGPAIGDLPYTYTPDAASTGSADRAERRGATVTLTATCGVVSTTCGVVSTTCGVVSTT